MGYFRVTAMGDKMTFEAPDLDDAKEQFVALMGDDVPESLLTWKEVKEPPKNGCAADARPKKGGKK